MEVKMEEVQMERLAAAILLRAVEEWEDPEKHFDIERFLKSEWFDELVEFVQLDPKEVRCQFLEGTYKKEIDTRSAYR